MVLKSLGTMRKVYTVCLSNLRKLNILVLLTHKSVCSGWKFGHDAINKLHVSSNLNIWI
ncbi:hypothetical protein MtrunA17_Chr4g0074321 [Medicago truncatula]|uniref:Uncharacterized protein n=1 Tax=Medicago truncatula TaxID=3880 RepID=A0A396IID6_MEDTR|nr:hypothetical protein MtrunA17_Chr4g0074321 [Medicago truncatula]